MRDRHVEELRRAWPSLPSRERVAAFRRLTTEQAESLFERLSSRSRAVVLTAMTPAERQLWLRQLAPDDAADVVQQVEPDRRDQLLELLDEPTRAEVRGLMAYAEDAAGGLMNPRFVRVRSESTVGEALFYLRRQARAGVEFLHYVYVLDQEQHLLGVVSFRELFTAPEDAAVGSVMVTAVVRAPERMDQEAVARLLAEHDLTAVPVVDNEERMIGVVTVDDIVDVVQQEATEDIQKIGGSDQLESPYLQTGLLPMVGKRAGWLAVLFAGEMLTATAMARYEVEIARAVVLALFVPLIISSGGNSGSQASTLVIRAMALHEVRPRDWWRVLRRELLAGLLLGLALAAMGVVRIVAGESLFHTYGEHHARIAATVAVSLVGVVVWGTLAGSMLPFLLRRLGLDEARASAPLVATLVDVFGLMIYFNVAWWMLRGSLL